MSATPSTVVLERTWENWFAIAISFSVLYASIRWRPCASAAKRDYP